MSTYGECARRQLGLQAVRRAVRLLLLWNVLGSASVWCFTGRSRRGTRRATHRMVNGILLDQAGMAAVDSRCSKDVARLQTAAVALAIP